MVVPLLTSRAAVGLVALVALTGLVDCGGDEAEPASTATSAPAGGLALGSPALKEGGPIPPEYTCDGANLSPALEWSGTPAGTHAFALLMTDPDAPGNGGYVHWVVFGIPGEVTSLPAGASPGGTLPTGTLEGKNSAGRPGYTGPCPPKGQEHRYVFRLFALDAPLDLRAGANGDGLVDALRKVKVLGESTLTSPYRRK